MKRLSHFSKGFGIARIAAMQSTLCLFFLLLQSARSENVIISGTTLRVYSGTSLISSENLVIRSGATLNNTGILILKKGLANENAGMNSLGSGPVELTGTVIQSIAGQNVFANLLVNNPAGIAIGGNTTVNGTLTLTSGKVVLGTNNLLLGPLAVISGTPTALAMIIVTSSGELRKEFPAGFAGSFTYPVGDDTGVSEYSPVTLSFTEGIFAAGNYTGVSLKNEIYPTPDITGNYLNRFWKITRFGIDGLACNATFQYLPADVIGTEGKLSCTKVDDMPWITYGPTDAALHLLSANGIVTFGSFTGVKSTTTPLNQELANIIIPNGMATCYDATQVLTVAGGGTTFIVENNGIVTLIAGAKISMLAGTKVTSSGYLLGRITTDGNYCETLLNPLVASTLNEQALGVQTVAKNQFVKIYPNPTTDVAIVELVDGVSSGVADVIVYSMHGGKLYQKQMNGESRFQFSLLGKPTGIYIIRIQSGNRCEIAKIVKY
jgi:hypothetical protein